LIKRVANGSDEFFLVERLDKKGKGAGLHTIALAAQSSWPVMKITRVPGDLAHKCASSSIPVILSIQISRTTSRTGFVTNVIEEIVWFAKGTYAESLLFEQSTDGFSDRRIIVNQIAELRGGNSRRLSRQFCARLLAHVWNNASDETALARQREIRL
jgi:hypothetical protein